MNKKSNIIVGLVVVAVVTLLVVGMEVWPKAGKGGEQQAAAQSSQKAVSSVQKNAESVENVENASSSTSQSDSFVASKQGKKYFPVDCGSSKTIKEENRVYFGSEAEAQSAGYERTLSCK